MRNFPVPHIQIEDDVHQEIKEELAPYMKITAGSGDGSVLKELPASKAQIPVVCVTENQWESIQLRKEFFRKLYVLAYFRHVENAKQLFAFHSENKYLLMSYHSYLLKQLGAIAANHKQESFTKVRNTYNEKLEELLKYPAKASSHVNVCQHIAGYFKHELTENEKEALKSKMMEYLDGSTSLSVITEQLYSLADRYQKDYLLQQTYFAPYPTYLVTI
ncbi:YbgA family protein [Halobacillus salinarum]|uniref:YbgA family protein n=1 Tax=Halobacillus salinarum TaxID=2932257 RepID=A0ABY4EN51_9BACI|nr:YbgA family protein [Halobacillus salinarum]UOQ45273.1 YbgA family protein [Halobacillus salinarum]